MEIPRANFAALSCHGCNYAIGGRSNSNVAMESVKVYDRETKIWSFVSPMKFGRFDRAACVRWKHLCCWWS